jgi:hypothetical protein
MQEAFKSWWLCLTQIHNTGDAGGTKKGLQGMAQSEGKENSIYYMQIHFKELLLSIKVL